MNWWIGEFVVSFFDVTNRLNVPCFLKSGLKGLKGFLWYSHFSTFRLAIVANTDGGQYCPQAVPNNRWSYYDGTEMIGDDITIECHGASAKKGKKVWQQSENFKTISCPGAFILKEFIKKWSKVNSSEG